MLSEALNGASNANGYWLNASGKGYPKFHPRGVSVSPFNALFMALHSDKNGCGSNLFIHYNEAKAMGMSVREHERGVPFLFYNWNRYVNRNNPEEIISAQPISDWTNRTGNITRVCITGKCAPSST